MFKHIYGGGPLPAWVLAAEQEATGATAGALHPSAHAQQSTGLSRPNLLDQASGDITASLGLSHGQEIVSKSARMGMDRGDADVTVRALQKTAKALKGLVEAETSAELGAARRALRRQRGDLQGGGRGRPGNRRLPSDVAEAAAGRSRGAGWSAAAAVGGMQDGLQGGSRGAVAAAANGRGGVVTRAAFVNPRSAAAASVHAVGRPGSAAASSSSSSSSSSAVSSSKADRVAPKALRECRAAL